MNSSQILPVTHHSSGLSAGLSWTPIGRFRRLCSAERLRGNKSSAGVSVNGRPCVHMCVFDDWLPTVTSSSLSPCGPEITRSGL